MKRKAIAGLGMFFLLGGCKSAVRAYDECTYGTTECESGVDCFNVSYNGASAGLCTRSCRTDYDCPIDPRGFSGTCLTFDSGYSYQCFESCASQYDCAGGWQCVPSTAGVNVCLPY